MALELKQNLRLSQQLIMTPQLQQAIKLLQLSRLEMIDTINQELQENPLLEEATSEDEQERIIEPDMDDKPSMDMEEVKVVDRTEEVTGEGDGREDFDWDNYLEDYSTSASSYSKMQNGEAPTWDNVLTATATLTDHLMWQLKLSRLNDLEMKLGEQIIGNLDEGGYLMATLKEIADQEGVAEDTVEDVLAKVQEFDPAGVAARDLKECLLLQAKHLGMLNPLVEAIIKEHLKDLEVKNYHHIAKTLKIPIADVLHAVMLIGRMDPKPGEVYNEERIQAIIPDVFVFKSGDDYKIVLNDENLPQLRISNFYREIMGNVKGNPHAESSKKYIKERVQSASWFIKSIQQRQRTIYNVSESIVKYQKEFFDRGIGYLKPLVLRDIADDVEMHESTISRVVTNKYMHTPRGIFELKYFFSSSIQRTNGDAIASKSVKEAIKRIIDGEDPKKPYSDNKIVVLLEKEGISIARRTIAKYRDMLGILPTSKRREFF
ncbi:MAG: RNA polymerase factor sigma-54 [Deltaproteobacteria bacterium]|nr:RNA polymerase factor sigma-54 [Deltaproteobacteria bacterium]